jgi:hypothetical protein
MLAMSPLLPLKDFIPEEAFRAKIYVILLLLRDLLPFTTSESSFFNVGNIKRYRYSVRANPREQTDKADSLKGENCLPLDPLTTMPSSAMIATQVTSP